MRRVFGALTLVWTLSACNGDEVPLVPMPDAGEQDAALGDRDGGGAPPDAATETDAAPEVDAAPEADAAPEVDAAPETDAAPSEPDTGAPEVDMGAPEVDMGMAPEDLDWIDDVSCMDEFDPGECVEGTTELREEQASPHIPEEEPIEYASNPPANGPHRGTWARWGEYVYLPPQRWVHNLEHGGVAFLYNPCAPPFELNALRSIAQNRPADDGGDFRWVMTPHPGLPAAFAVVAWRHVYLAPCVREDEINAFIDEHYRQAPEDVAGDGRYERAFIGR